MVIDFQKLKKLREETGYSFSLVKEALEFAKNDEKKALAYLKKKSAETIAKKGNREASQGGIFSYVHHNKKVASLVELRCETDFVSGNEEFQNLGRELAMQSASVPVGSVEELLASEYIREPDKKISDLLDSAVTKFGEHIKIARALRWQVGEET